MIAVEFSQSFALKSFKSFPKLHDYGLHNTCSHTKDHFAQITSQVMIGGWAGGWPSG